MCALQHISNMRDSFWFSKYQSMIQAQDRKSRLRLGSKPAETRSLINNIDSTMNAFQLKSNQKSVMSI